MKQDWVLYQHGREWVVGTMAPMSKIGSSGGVLQEGWLDGRVESTTVCATLGAAMDVLWRREREARQQGRTGPDSRPGPTGPAGRDEEPAHRHDIADRLLTEAQALPDGSLGFGLLSDALGEIVRLRSLVRDQSARGVSETVRREGDEEPAHRHEARYLDGYRAALRAVRAALLTLTPGFLPPGRWADPEEAAARDTLNRMREDTPDRPTQPLVTPSVDASLHRILQEKTQALRQSWDTALHDQLRQDDTQERVRHLPLRTYFKRWQSCERALEEALARDRQTSTPATRAAALVARGNLVLAREALLKVQVPE